MFKNDYIYAKEIEYMANRYEAHQADKNIPTPGGKTWTPKRKTPGKTPPTINEVVRSRSRRTISKMRSQGDVSVVDPDVHQEAIRRMYQPE